MPNIYAVAHAVLSPLGNTAEENFEAVLNYTSGIRQQEDPAISPAPFWASRLGNRQWEALDQLKSGIPNGLSPFELMCAYVVKQALSQTRIGAAAEDCILILSSTKGNIEWLQQESDERINLSTSAKRLSSCFGFSQPPMVVSNACISGSLALTIAGRMLEAGKCKHAIVVGCDRLSGFVLQGFQSFRAIADEVCRPFDAQRKGINLGEAAACIILSASDQAGLSAPLALLAGAGLSTDANHLSAPSRTGKELAAAIGQAYAMAGISSAQLGMISAHGTGTLFNDEMEAKAIHLAGAGQVPLHSFKSYVGHTLGAAGIIESVIACSAMQEQLILPSLGYETSGVADLVKVATGVQPAAYDYLLKTASGFGGCNAALIWKRYH